MEDTPAEQKIIEKTIITPNSENETTATEKKTNPSQRQLDHLKFARSMKRLKQQQKEHEVDTQNKNLEFIYKRLTNIENNVQQLVEQPINYQTTRIAKRKHSKRSAEDSEDSEKPKKSRKIEEKIIVTEKPNSFIYDTLLPTFGRACFMGGSMLMLSVIKNYAANGFKTTSDGDTIGGYYIGKDI